ncbi:glutathione S-transferase [Rhodovibrio sodomensis]|uniref:Glutathione S-transferase n=1 Tax=Rhodovibrio sodomensis TaxID=1088 RepID=A0ABS1DK68_9PROT|nr:glutathione S-transferase [Rhodovibrio sodomensis]MBK1670487.1 glutathione S-transferase [Rhodovibrio sodomensis]
MLTLHRHALSGHSHRVQLFLSLTGLAHEIVEVDLPNGAHEQSDFLQKSLFGQVPVLEDGDVTIADSNAILVYLARRYANPEWCPVEPETAAQVQRWLSVAAGELKQGPADARLVTVLGAKLDHARAKAIAQELFGVLDGYLGGRSWLAADRPTIADVACYTYTAHAPEGEVSLTPYPNIRDWLRRLESLDGFVAMQPTAVGYAA